MQPLPSRWLPLLLHMISIPMIYITTEPNLAQSVHMYPGACSGDRDHGIRESMHLNLHDLYTHCLYPHHAECIETQSVLMYSSMIRHHCKKKGKRGFLSKTPLSSMFNKLKMYIMALCYHFNITKCLLLSTFLF